MRGHRCGERFRNGDRGFIADPGNWDGSSKVEALDLIGVGVVEEIDLIVRLNAFDRNPHVHLASNRYDRLDDGFDVAARPFETLLKLRSILILSNGNCQR
jgi:hypothetical protein